MISYGSAADQHGELWLPAGPGPAPVAVLLHGGYWRARYRLDLMHALAADLAARGYAAWNLEYRRADTPGGGWPGTFADVAAGLDALAGLAERFPLDLGRVTVIGHSAGGQLALWAAARRPAAGPRPAGPRPAGARVTAALAVSLAGVCDLAAAADLRLSDGAAISLLGGSPAEVPAVYAAASPLALLPLGVRQLIVHGTMDGNVPFDLSERYAAAARAAGDACAFLPLAGADHFDVIDPASPAWAAVLSRL